jgi:hypothetical protein
MLTAFFAQAVTKARRTGCKFVVMRYFAVQQAQRVALKARFAVVAQFFQMRAEIILQFGSVLRAAFGAAHGIDFQVQIL